MDRGSIRQLIEAAAQLPVDGERVDQLAQSLARQLRTLAQAVGELAGGANLASEAASVEEYADQVRTALTLATRDSVDAPVDSPEVRVLRALGVLATRAAAVLTESSPGTDTSSRWGLPHILAAAFGEFGVSEEDTYTPGWPGG